MSYINKIIDWYFSKNSLPYWCILLLDCLICFFSGVFVCWLFFKGSQTLGNIVPISRTLLFYMVFNVLGFKLFHTYSGIIRYSSFIDLQRVAYAMLTACICVLIVHYPILFWKEGNVFVPLHSRHIVSIYLVSTILLWAVRVVVKTVYDISFGLEGGMRTLVYGVKDGGIGIAKNIRNQKPTKFRLKGFVTNDKAYEGKMLMGERVYMVDDDFEKNLLRLNIQAVLVSPLQNENFREDQRLQDILISNGIKMYMSPKTHEWHLGNNYKSLQLQEVNIEDLLPRDEIEVDLRCSVRSYGERLYNEPYARNVVVVKSQWQKVEEAPRPAPEQPAQQPTAEQKDAIEKLNKMAEEAASGKEGGSEDELPF